MVIGDTCCSGFGFGFFKIDGDACGIGIDGGMALSKLVVRGVSIELGSSSMRRLAKLLGSLSSVGDDDFTSSFDFFFDTVFLGAFFLFLFFFPISLSLRALSL